ncbi:MAG TPA: PKD domain-containing protein [Chloroflexia bacterium]|nr:PKD domain-containing protein [Chloroflexia bacterium]
MPVHSRRSLGLHAFTRHATARHLLGPGLLLLAALLPVAARAQDDLPAIEVSGPTEGIFGQRLTFTTTARNCTATENGWGWSTTSGHVIGANNAAVVDVIWSTTGQMTVRAANSGCGPAVGRLRVTIHPNTPPPAPLVAAFTSAPAAPVAGEAVTFTSTASGGITSQLWDFGDGATASGAQASHTISSGGSYTVSLAVAGSGCAPAPFCEASASQLLVVGEAEPPPPPRQYLFGALRKRSGDTVRALPLLLYNPDQQPMDLLLRFVAVGSARGSEYAAALTLEPNRTLRLDDPLHALFGLLDATGVVVVEGASIGGVLPAAQLESLDESVAATAAPRRTGQLVAALGGSAKAGAGQRQVLVGLRQDTSSRTVLWLHSPGDGARVDLVYRDLDGVELGRLSGFTVAPWGVRQVAPARHPLPAGFAGRFTVEVLVESGEVLTAAQLTSTKPAAVVYVAGETR